MTARRILRFASIGLVALIILGVVGMLVWAETGTYPAGAVALSALESTDRVTATQDKWIAFTPVEKMETGLIFCPGGLVEPTAYAPILRRIAEEGVLVIITPMPLNLAILNTGAANAVVDDYPHTFTWTTAGHSPGGASAATFGQNDPTRIDAIALWDSYPPNRAGLSDNTISGVFIFGTTDNVPSTEGFNDKRHLLPANTEFAGIEGTSHAQFGDYCPRKVMSLPQ